MWGLLTHSLFAMIVTKLITENVFPAATVSGALFVKFRFFGCLSLVTAKLFNVDYVEIMVPIIGKLIKEKNPS
jgi:pheromone shutdown protein TraB